MDLTPQLDAKLDRLLEGQVRLEVKVEGFEARVGRVEREVSAEKARLDNKFVTDVRPLRARYDGFSFFLKSLGVLSLVLGIVAGLFTINRQMAAPPPAPATSPAPAQGKDNAQVPEVRPRRR